MSDYLDDPFFTTEPGFEFLADWRKGWQFGEQGIVSRIADAIKFSDPVAVEIGAGDGGELPLTCEGLLDCYWKIVAFECDEHSRKSLTEHLLLCPKAKPVVRGRYEGGPIPQCDVLVIDIDGRDSVAMKHALQWCHPSLVVIEHYDIGGPYMNGVEQSLGDPIPEWLLGMTLGVPEGSNFVIQDRYQYLDTIADQHDLMPICRTRVNSFYMPPKLAQDLYCNV